MEVASALAILGVHLSRIGEEIVLWSSVEFGFMSLSDAFSTSSSMMPQKKNPDVAELVRGKSARMMGSLTTLLVLEKSLCFGYGRDLQEDKEPIFDAFDAAIVCLDALTGRDRDGDVPGAIGCARRSRGHLCATDVADFLATRGLPFREAHHVVGALVREADTRGVELGELPESALVAAHPLLTGPELKSALDPEAAVERRALVGGPAKVRVQAAILSARVSGRHRRTGERVVGRRSSPTRADAWRGPLSNITAARSPRTPSAVPRPDRDRRLRAARA